MNNALPIRLFIICGMLGTIIGILNFMLWTSLGLATVPIASHLLVGVLAVIIANKINDWLTKREEEGND